MLMKSMGAILRLVKLKKRPPKRPLINLFWLSVSVTQY